VAVPPFRRITLAVGLAMFVDAALYLAVLPLLPHYAERFGLGTLGAAVVLVAYPAATPVISLACIPLVPRVGARRIALAAASLMTAATIAFALAPNAPVLIGARFLQGVASATVWTASRAWVTHNAPPARRGRETGIVMGLLSAGSIAGPGVGALAAWVGSAPAFMLVAAVAALTTLATALAPAGMGVAAEPDLRASLGRALRNPLARAALAMALIDPLAFGAIDLLVPLDLGAHGISTVVIAGALTTGAVLGAIAGPIGGRVVDRIGAPRVGLATACLVALCPLPLAVGLPTWTELAVLVIVSPIFAVAAAAMYPLASAGADGARVAHIVVNGLMGAGWALGFTVAPLVAAAIAQVIGRSAAFATCTVLCLPLLAVLVRGTRAESGAAAATHGA
jgi:MFS family permease